MQSTLGIAGGTIAFQDSGEGPVVLLLHGFPGTSRLWTEVTPSLVELGFRAIAPDLVGYGRSTIQPGIPIDMGSQARWMLQLLDSLSVENVIVIAHDVGSAADARDAVGIRGR